MKAITDWLSKSQHTLLVLGLASLAVIAGIEVPDSRWTKLGGVLEHIATDPAGAIMMAGVIGSVAAAFRAAWQRDPARATPPPPSSSTGGFAALDALYFIAAVAGVAFAVLALHGCGASALQQSAVGVTVALRAEEAVSAAVVADLDRRMDACPAATPTDSADVIAAHNTCVDRERASVADLTDALSAIELSIRAVGAGIATAAEVDAGQAIPTVLLDTLREVLALWDRVEVALRAHGIDVPPEIGLVVAALGALVGPAS